MHFILRCALPALLLTACADGGERQARQYLPARGDVQIEGPVTHIDLEPMTRDGDGRISIRDPDYGVLVVLVPARRHQLCQAGYPDDVSALGTGTLVQARGEVATRREISVCSRDTHFLRALDRADP